MIQWLRKHNKVGLIDHHKFRCQKFRILSLLHEFVHLMIDNENDDILINHEEQTNAERKINEIAASFLVPGNVIEMEMERLHQPKLAIDNIAYILKTSTSVVAIRAYKLGYISWELHKEIIQEAKNNYNLSKKNRENSGNFYSNAMNRMSKDYYTTIIHQAEGGKLQFTEAYKLLSLSGRTYDTFKNKIGNKVYE